MQSDSPALAPLGLVFLLAFTNLAAAAYLAWRHWWFFRNPPRHAPAESGLVSPADGVVVYAREVAPHEDVVVIKQGLAARVADIVREDVAEPKYVIGVFMSPLDVHYNRAPLDAEIADIRRHPGHGPNRHMGPMHWRVLLRRPPYHAGSVHIVQNERTVTRFVGRYRETPLSFYVVQIGAKTVRGIDSFVAAGERVTRSETFGMIRIGSQVDLVVARQPGMKLCVTPGQRVRAGETILVQ